ncbi:MAG TPA: DUF4012 domain-containing protein [Chloroflexota bacterium]|nr:DUF4012 domain-containing protein [Chloroflexota bacterium]
MSDIPRAIAAVPPRHDADTAGAALETPNAKSRRLGRPGLLWCLVPALAVVSMLGLSGVQVLRARQQMLAGVAGVQQAAIALHRPLALADAGRRARLRRQLQASQADFASARRDLHWLGPILDHLGWLPGPGAQLAAAPAVADAAFYSTRAAIEIVDGLDPVWGVLRGASGSSRLASLARVMTRSEPSFVQATHDSSTAAAATRGLPAHLGSRAVDAALMRLRVDLPRLQSAAGWLALSPLLFGDATTNRVLFAWENPAELRATGGFLGASELATVTRGRLQLTFYGHQLPHEITRVLPPLPEAEYTPEAYWQWCDSNWSPDFRLSARLERWFYGQDTGVWPNAVVDYLDTATPTVLLGTGPVYLPGYRVWATSENVTALAERFVNGSYKGPLAAGLQDTVRKQFFGAVMQAIVQRVETMPPARWPRLAETLGRLIAGHQILLWDSNPTVEAAITHLGADGAIHSGSGDYLFVVDDNRSYNKLNPYVREAAAYRVAVRPDLSLDSTLTLTYHVGVSPANLEGYGPMWGLWGTKHDYQDFIRVLVPAGARLVSASGLDLWKPEPAYGLTELAGRVLVHQGQTHAVTLHYRVPASALSSTPGWYHLRIQQQPGSNLHAVEVHLSGIAPVTIGTRAALHPGPDRAGTFIATGGSLSVSLSGAWPRRTASVRATGNDPYLPYQYLADRRHGL